MFQRHLLVQVENIKVGLFVHAFFPGHWIEEQRDVEFLQLFLRQPLPTAHQTHGIYYIIDDVFAFVCIGAPVVTRVA